MFVGMWMAKEVIAVEPSLSLAAAAKRMAEQRIPRLPVLENANYDSPLVGIISRTDVLHALPLETNPFSTTQRDVHTASAIFAAGARCDDGESVTIETDAPIEAAATLMRDRKIGALPVMRGALLVALITESDVFRAFAQLFDLSEMGARITFDHEP